MYELFPSSSISATQQHPIPHPFRLKAFFFPVRMARTSGMRLGVVGRVTNSKSNCTMLFVGASFENVQRSTDHVDARAPSSLLGRILVCTFFGKKSTVSGKLKKKSLL